MLDGYISEKEQLESMRKWWDDNGKFLAIAVIIGLAVGFGWRYWQKVQVHYAQNAAMIYQSVLDADQKNNTVTAQGGAKILQDRFDRTPYASLATLLWAKEAVAKNDLSTATTQLQWVIDHGKPNRVKEIARLSLARIYLSQQKSQAALAAVEKTDDKQFEPMVDWVKGDVLTQQGDTKNAKAYYLKAKNAFAGFPPAQQFLTQQLAN